ncbi:hypothetical protein [Dankookia sp. P2]|uniref:hypothetical protein n=1 Tax=Dankookia sp. P2 TaxID=3423955 RepID=UPI003D6736E9
MTDALPGSVAHAMALSQPARRPLLLCLSHLRWNFVFQRPQHLLTRAARDHEVIFFEEPLFQPGIVPRLDRQLTPEGVTVAVPMLPEGCRVRQWWRRSVACWMVCWRRRRGAR